MEEQIYGRQVKKESLAGRIIDEHNIERHTDKEDDSLYDTSKLHLNVVDRPQLLFPEEDKVLASVVYEHGNIVWSLHKHDNLLEHKVDEDLSKDDIEKAWTTFKEEEELKKSLSKSIQTQILRKRLPKYVNNLIDSAQDNKIIDEGQKTK